jgi:hypothetical protein
MSSGKEGGKTPAEQGLGGSKARPYDTSIQRKNLLQHASVLCYEAKRADNLL